MLLFTTSASLVRVGLRSAERASPYRILPVRRASALAPGQPKLVGRARPLDGANRDSLALTLSVAPQ